MGNFAISNNQANQIGDNIKITVLADKHTQVNVGIDAPDDVEIWREEIYDKIQGSSME